MLDREEEREQPEDDEDVLEKQTRERSDKNRSDWNERSWNWGRGLTGGLLVGAFIDHATRSATLPCKGIALIVPEQTMDGLVVILVVAPNYIQISFLEVDLPPPQSTVSLLPYCNYWTQLVINIK